jgi:hypothetical protein
MIIDMDKPCIGSLLYAVARRMLQLLEHILINTHGDLTTVNLKAVMLV